MPGPVGVIDTRRGGSATRFRTAADRMLRHGGMSLDAREVLDGAGHVGTVQLDGRPAAIGAAAEHGVVAGWHGVIYNEGALRAELRQPAPGSLAEVLAALYRERGAGFVALVEGEFCLFVIDERERRVLLASDVVGSCPIYWEADQTGLVFASDLSALLRATTGRRRIDLRAVADYLTLGAVLGQKTLAQGVQLLDPGTILTCDITTGRITTAAYARLEEYFAPKAARQDDYMSAVQSAFVAAVDRSLGGTLPIGLSLSGGLDSRAILSAVNGRAGSLTTYTLGVEGCADQVIADQLARIAGTHHQFFRLDSAYLRDFLPNMVRMVSITDGMYLSHGLTEMLAIGFLKETGIAVLLRGHGGELAKARLAWPLHTDDHVYTLSSLDELIPYLSARANYVTGTLPLSSLLTPEAAKAAGRGAADSFAAVLRGTHLTPAEACSYLYLRELHRRFTVPSLELFRTLVDVRLPYVDPEFLRVLLGAPAAWRDRTAIHRMLTGAGIPALVRVRNSNTGAPASAGPLKEFVFDKCNTVLKRLNVRGYRHYHNFDAWMRRKLFDAVEAELLAPDARVRAFVPDAALRSVIRETRDGTADRSYLLQVLLILELWQRENQIEGVAA